MKLYVAGPISANYLLDAMEHIRHGINVARLLIMQGHEVFCPHLDFLYALQCGETGTVDEEDLKRNSMSFVTDWAEALYVLDGWENSRGTKAEIEKAKEKGLPVFYGPTDLREYRRSNVSSVA